MVDAKEWQNCLTALEGELSSHEVDTWIKPLQPVLDGNTLRLLAPNKYIKDYVDEHHHSRLDELMRNRGAKAVELQVGDGDGALPSGEGGGRKGKGRGKGKSKGEPAGEGFYPAMGLNSNFTFDTFVEGRSNHVAKAAAMQVAENLSSSRDPLLLYGDVGLGKTHLMQAVGNCIAERRPKLKVVYVYSNYFTEVMVRAMQKNAMLDFNAYYNSVDVLLMDDVQFLFKDRPKTAEVFFNLFNQLEGRGKQMVFTCDRYPKELPDAEERLISRILGGMTMPVEQPDLETRVAILRKKAEQYSFALSSDVAFFVARHIKSNVRELDGCLKRLIADARHSGQPTTVETVKESLKDVLAILDRLISIENIQKVVAEYYNIRLGDLLAKRRTRSIARPRQVAMALARELTNRSLPEIGDAFGGRDHTTVLHACRRVEELLESSREIREDYANLQRKLTA